MFRSSELPLPSDYDERLVLLEEWLQDAERLYGLCKHAYDSAQHNERMIFGAALAYLKGIRDLTAIAVSGCQKHPNESPEEIGKIVEMVRALPS